MVPVRKYSRVIWSKVLTVLSLCHTNFKTISPLFDLLSGLLVSSLLAQGLFRLTMVDWLETAVKYINSVMLSAYI